MLGCTANEDTAGPRGAGGGSGVAGGAVLPHEGEETHAHESEAPKVEEPKVEEPKVEEPKVEEPKVEEPAGDAPKSE